MFLLERQRRAETRRILLSDFKNSAELFWKRSGKKVFHPPLSSSSVLRYFSHSPRRVCIHRDCLADCLEFFSRTGSSRKRILFAGQSQGWCIANTSRDKQIELIWIFNLYVVTILSIVKFEKGDGDHTSCSILALLILFSPSLLTFGFQPKRLRSYLYLRRLPIK